MTPATRADVPDRRMPRQAKPDEPGDAAADARVGFTVMRETHVPGLWQEAQALLLARAVGFVPSSLETLVFKSKRTVQDQLSRAEDTVCQSLGLQRRDSYVTGAWVAFHQECCMAAALSALEGGRLWDTIMRRDAQNAAPNAARSPEIGRPTLDSVLGRRPARRAEEYDAGGKT